MVKNSNTEEKILEAAKTIFVKKGMAGARMQEIADEAGINKALLHYYFRNKEKLFERIFKEAFSSIVSGIGKALNTEEPFFDKIKHLINVYIDVFMQNPYLPGFVLNEINQNPEGLHKIIEAELENTLTAFFIQVMNEINVGTIRAINPVHLILNIIGMIVIPFGARNMLAPLLEKKVGVDYDLVLTERKEIIYQFVYNALKVD